MVSFDIPNPIDCNYNDGASAVIVDIRGSSELVRSKSYSDSAENYNKALAEHTNFMMQMYKSFFSRISDLPFGQQFSFNDTGDGFLSVFWGKEHPLRALKMASAIHEHLLSQEYLQSNGIEFGIGLHTGGCFIYRVPPPIGRDFVFGIVANTAARVEKFTKNLHDSEKNPKDNPRILFTGNFKDFLMPLLPEGLKSEIVRVSAFRLGVNDGKREGHFLYSITPRLIRSLSNQRQQSL